MTGNWHALGCTNDRMTITGGQPVAGTPVIVKNTYMGTACTYILISHNKIATQTSVSMIGHSLRKTDLVWHIFLVRL